MTLPVLFGGEEGKELFCTVSKKKIKSKAYLPTLFFSGKEPETQLSFFLPHSHMRFIHKRNWPS